MKVSQHNHFTFHSDISDKVAQFTQSRKGENRVGDCLPNNWKDSIVQYVILGISESIGPRQILEERGLKRDLMHF